MEKEVRIPILGVIEESETFTGNERCFLDYYPHGEGVYLVKIGSCFRQLRDVRIRNEKTSDGRTRCDLAIFPIRSSAVVEEIKKEHEATLKDYIEECCVKILTSVNANRDDVRNVDEKMSVLIKQLASDITCLKEALNSIKEDGVTSGNGISEKTLLGALEIVTKKRTIIWQTKTANLIFFWCSRKVIPCRQSFRLIQSPRCTQTKGIKN